MDSRVTLRLAGGLGNQLFQFSAAIKACELLGLQPESIFIDTRFLASYEAQHRCELGFFLDMFPGVQVGIPSFGGPAIISRLRLCRIYDSELSACSLVSSVGHLLSLSPTRSRSAVLDGYFQHPDVLYSEELREYLRSSLLAAKKDLIDSVHQGCKTVGVHLRRGDYVTSKGASRVFRTIPLDYYRAALERLPRGLRVVVFSDDALLSSSFAAEIGGVDSRALRLALSDEFCLLAACDHYVIANSTFSWWASYLGYYDGKTVISPMNWYTDNSRNKLNPLLLPYFHLLDD